MRSPPSNYSLDEGIFAAALYNLLSMGLARHLLTLKRTELNSLRGASKNFGSRSSSERRETCELSKSFTLRGSLSWEPRFGKEELRRFGWVLSYRRSLLNCKLCALDELKIKTRFLTDFLTIIMLQFDLPRLLGLILQLISLRENSLWGNRRLGFGGSESLSYFSSSFVSGVSKYSASCFALGLSAIFYLLSIILKLFSLSSINSFLRPI